MEFDDVQAGRGVTQRRVDAADPSVAFRLRAIGLGRHAL
jgi:hypothetical protein